MKNRFNNYLSRIRERFNKDKRINYSHAKQRYEIEIPMELVEGNRKPKDFDLASQRNGFQRFLTTDIKEMVEELEVREEILNQAIVPFLITLFTQFYQRKEVWNRAIDCLKELDCITSLQIASTQSTVEMCRPEFVTRDSAYMELREMNHPQLIGKDMEFISNDVIIGENEEQVLLVTGPNMGGKSTLLRMTCAAAILAQVGCFVPA